MIIAGSPSGKGLAMCGRDRQTSHTGLVEGGEGRAGRRRGERKGREVLQGHMTEEVGH